MGLSIKILDLSATTLTADWVLAGCGVVVGGAVWQGWSFVL
jgi:hypothetical protein